MNLTFLQRRIGIILFLAYTALYSRRLNCSCVLRRVTTECNLFYHMTISDVSSFHSKASPAFTHKLILTFNNFALLLWDTGGNQPPKFWPKMRRIRNSQQFKVIYGESVSLLQVSEDITRADRRKLRNITINRLHGSVNWSNCVNPCGGGVEYLHREPASRKRRRNGTKKGRAIA
jgi:hypothetical protein